MSISVLILTKNEEADLSACLHSIIGCDDIWILDSYSTDQTVLIAKNHGVHIVQRVFDNFASQRNFALETFEFKHPWILILDADERVNINLIAEIEKFIDVAPENIAAARVRRRDFFRGRWLKHAQISPFFIRLIRKGRAKFEREINEILIVDGDIFDLPGYLDHFPFSKGITHWVAKHNIYSTMEAKQLLSKSEFCPKMKSALFHSDFNVRRQHQKAIFYKMPGRPLIKFVYMFFARRAFMDGMPGIHYTLLQCIYEYFISLKSKE